MTKPQTTPIPKEELEAALRALCRRIASQIVLAMACRNADFSYMAQKLDKPEEYIRTCVHQLIEGIALDLSTISDLALSLGMEWRFELIGRDQ